MAFCSNCGRELSPAAVQCPHCGVPTHAAATAEVVQRGGGGEGQLDGLAVGSLVASLASFVILPVVGSILAIVLGNISIARIDADPGLRGRELARAGVIIGWVGIVLEVIAILLIILFIVSIGHIFD